MSLNEEMTAAARSLSASARITFATGAAVTLGAGDVVAFTVEEGADSALLPGAVLSARMALTLNNDAGQWRFGGSLRGARPLVGATVELFVSAGAQALPCGVFVVSSAQAEARGGTVRLSGEDSIASEMAAPFADGLTYPATLAEIWAHLVAQTRYVWAGTLPNGDAVVDAAPDWDGASIRRAAGWIAQAAGCFVRAGRAGGLEIVPCAGGEATLRRLSVLTDGATLRPGRALSITPAGAEAGPLRGRRHRRRRDGFNLGQPAVPVRRGHLPLLATARSRSWPG